MGAWTGLGCARALPRPRSSPSPGDRHTLFLISCCFATTGLVDCDSWALHTLKSSPSPPGRGMISAQRLDLGVSLCLFLASQNVCRWQVPSFFTVTVSFAFSLSGRRRVRPAAAFRRCLSSVTRRPDRAGCHAGASPRDRGAHCGASAHLHPWYGTVLLWQ